MVRVTLHVVTVEVGEQPKVLPKSPIGDAIGYALGNWTALKRYTEDGDLEIDNNGAERSLRGIAVGRKNWLWYGSDRGGQTAAILTRFTATCKGAAERPGLDKVFQLAHRKAFDVLLFWSLDRLSREGSRKTIAYLTRLDDYGVAWHSYSEPYISSLGVFADCIIALLSALAKQEKIRISERTKAGLERTRRVNGTRLGRPPTSADRLRKALRLRQDGLSFSQIGEKLGVTRTRAFQLVKDAEKAVA
jgi:DNA invertase Pin-like site-specific DNA recombinase